MTWTRSAGAGTIRVIPPSRPRVSSSMQPTSDSVPFPQPLANWGRLQASRRQQHVSVRARAQARSSETDTPPLAGPGSPTGRNTAVPATARTELTLRSESGPQYGVENDGFVLAAPD